jgi:hypothetical protein
VTDWARFDELARRAREDAPTPVDVTQRVMARLAIAPPPRALRGPELPLAVCAGVSLAAAAVVGGLSAGWWASAGDPLVELMRMMNVVLQ